MITKIGGRIVDVIQHADGSVDAEQLRKILEAGPDRVVTVERADGQVELVPERGRVQLGPDDSVLDRLNARRGR